MSADRVLLAIRDPAVAREAAALIEESAGLELAGAVTDRDELLAALGPGVDVAVVQEPAGGERDARVAREVAAAYPHVGIVLVAQRSDPDLLRVALRAGARDVLSLPLSLEPLERSLRDAAAWSRAVRSDSGAHEGGALASGRLVVVAGSKGGVGTTTVAVYTSLASVGLLGPGGVCVVDFDLQTGDIAHLLDLSPRRSVADLAAIEGPLSGRQLDDTLFRHRSGLNVLLAPERGEDAEEIDAPAARRILTALGERFELVVVDAGSIVTEAGGVASTLASEAVVVTRPEVPALRGANRLLELWRRLEVREPERTRVVLNGASKQAEVQPDLARQVLAAGLMETVIPAGERALEAATNSGRPERLDDKRLQRAYVGLAHELTPADERPAERPAGTRRLLERLGADSGQVTAEAIGSVWLLVLVALAVWQIALVGYSFVIAGHGAREGSRALAVGESVEEAVRDELPGPWRDGLKLETDGNEVGVAVAIPLVIPGVDGPIRVSSEAGTVVEDQPLPDSQARARVPAGDGSG